MKHSLCLLILLLSLSPLRAQPQPAPEAAPEAAPKPPAVRLNDGTIVTLLEEMRDDVATLAEIKLWRFQIQLPTPDLQLNYRLEMRRPDKTIEISRGDYWPPRETEFVLGLMPKGSESLDSAEKLKVYTGSFTPNSLKMMNGDSYSLRQCENPIKDLKILKDFMLLSSWEAANADGSVPLGKFYSGATQEPSKSELFLVFTTEKRPAPPQP